MALIRLYSNSEEMRKLVRDIAKPHKVSVRKVSPTTRLGHVDALVSTVRITRRVAFLAARFNTGYIFVLPESSEALASLIASGRDITLLGDDSRDDASACPVSGDDLGYQ